MSKAKAYTKMILERLQKKTQNDLIKSNNSSNQKTQATPSDLRHHANNVKSFFERFETHCAVYHQPVLSVQEKKPMRRRLFFELAELQHKPKHIACNTRKQSKGRLQTEPFVSEFKIDQPRKTGVKVMSKDFIRENKSMVLRKPQEKPKSIQSSQVISRYKSLKTMPSRSTTYGDQLNYRRMLVNPSPSSFTPLEPRPLERRQFKYERKRLSPRREAVHRCESYERFFLNRV